MKHNPAFLSREELVRSFVARQEDLAFVLDHIADNTGPSSQHLLVVAPRGMGKTTLVLRAAEAARTDPRFSKEWFPLVYAEETYEVMSAGELWLEGLRHLADQTNDPEMLAVHKDLRREPDEQRLYDRALGRLLEFADRQGKRILLVIENLHMLLDEQISKSDAWKLRKTLQHERRLMLLATATSSFEAIENVEQAFFDQFRIYRLEPLDLESARRVWSHVAGVPASAEHMRPLQILTGGNPRLLAILASFAGGMSLRALMGDLVRLVDDHTTYFKSNVDSLPAKERKVYITLAELWQPSTAREVADVARMTPSEVSALLNRLTQRGAVTTSGEERKRVYQLAERMYNIYYLMRRSGGDETRVRAVVDFMVAFYDPVSMSRVIRAIAEEGAGLGDQDRRDHLLVMESLFRREGNPRVREFWWKEAGAHIEKIPNAPRGLREDVGRIRMDRWTNELARTGLPVNEIVAVIRHEGSGSAMIAKAPTESWNSLLNQLATSGDVAAMNAALVTTLTGRVRIAVPLLHRLLEGNQSPARRALLLGLLGKCQELVGRSHAAEVAFGEATSLLPTAAGLAALHAIALAKLDGRVSEAEAEAFRAIHVEPATPLAWESLLGSLMRMSQRELTSSKCAHETGLFEGALKWEKRAAHALWAIVHGAVKGDSILVKKGFRSLWSVWDQGRPVPLFGRILLKDSIESQRLDKASAILNQLTSSLVESDIQSSFELLWKSERPAVHALAKPHLPILLADSTLGNANIPLVGLLFLLGDWKQGSMRLAALLAPSLRDDEAENLPDHTLELWTRLFIDAAATGRAREALDLLSPSPLARWLEPVVVALQSYVGQPHRAPLEIVEVARDVTDRIRARAKALEEGAKENTTVHAARPKSAPKKTTKPAKRTARSAQPGTKTRAKVK